MAKTYTNIKVATTHS